MPLLDRRHKAIALAMQRADKVRRPSPLPQSLTQYLDTGFQRLVADKLLRPQVREEFQLGNHPVAMRQEIGEHLKDFAPELDGFPSMMQLLALGIQDIVAKEVAHRSAFLSALAHILPQPSRGSQHPLGPAHALLRLHSAHHSTKIPRKCPESAPKVTCFPAWQDLHSSHVCSLAMPLALRRERRQQHPVAMTAKEDGTMGKKRSVVCGLGTTRSPHWGQWMGGTG